MAYHGAHLKYLTESGPKTAEWTPYGSWGGCFAGLGRGVRLPTDARNKPVPDTILAEMAMCGASRYNGLGVRQTEIDREITQAFLNGRFAAKLTDGAILAAEPYGSSFPSVAGNDPVKLSDSFGNRQAGQQAQDSFLQVVFRPEGNADRLITCFRIAQQAYKYGEFQDYGDIPKELREYIPLAVALSGSDGKAYCDGYVVFGTPTKDQILEYMKEVEVDDVDDLDFDDVGDRFDDDGTTFVTDNGIKQLMSRTSEEFEELCRDGVNPSLLFNGYVKDEYLNGAKFHGMRGDDPMGLAAPCRMDDKTGRRANTIPLRELCEFLKQHDK